MLKWFKNIEWISCGFWASKQVDTSCMCVSGASPARNAVEVTSLIAEWAMWCVLTGLSRPTTSIPSIRPIVRHVSCGYSQGDNSLWKKYPGRRFAELRWQFFLLISCGFIAGFFRLCAPVWTAKIFIYISDYRIHREQKYFLLFLSFIIRGSRLFVGIILE